MNYIKHLNQWMELASMDDRLSPFHMSIYMALFQFWNRHRFPDKFSISRNEVLQLSKVGSPKTYYRCLHQLHEFGYIQYFPSHNPLKGSVITITDLCDFDLYKLTNSKESSTENDLKSDENCSENEEISSSSTQVEDEQNCHSSCSKNDISSNHLVKPLFINNINLINYKQRERRTHARDKFNNEISFLNPKKQVKKKKKLPSNQSTKVSTQKSKTSTSDSSGRRSERNNEIPRGFLNPTLNQVKDYFLNQLASSYLKILPDANERLNEAEKFFYHYESNGWLLGGKIPMHNWKASCRSWIVKVPYFSKTDQNNYNRAPERKNFHVERFENYAEPL